LTSHPERRVCIEARSLGLLIAGKQIIGSGAPLLAAVISAGERGEVDAGLA
jgi:hypothetical protein